MILLCGLVRSYDPNSSACVAVQLQEMFGITPEKAEAIELEVVDVKDRVFNI